MALERKVLARRGQLLVALPARIRVHLGVVPGATVYLRASRLGEATIATKERPARGPERAEVDCPSCAAYRKEAEKLRARVVQRDAEEASVAYARGRGDEMRHTIRLEAAIAHLATRVDAVLPYVRPARRPRRAARRADVVAEPPTSLDAPLDESVAPARAIETAPAPVLDGAAIEEDTPASAPPSALSDGVERGV